MLKDKITNSRKVFRRINDDLNYIIQLTDNMEARQVAARLIVINEEISDGVELLIKKNNKDVKRQDLR